MASSEVVPPSGTTPTVSLPIPADEQLAAASRYRYQDTFARLAATNRFLRIAVLATAIAFVALAMVHLRTLSLLSHVRPVVVRINDVGRAEAVRYEALAYAPRDPEVRYFLRQFVTLHFARLRANVQRDFASSLLFLESQVARAALDAQREAMEKWLGSGEPDVDVEVKNVTLQDIRTPPYRASVDYERVYYQPMTRHELKRERYVGTFHFVVADSVPNDLIPVNPLGLLITYFREDQAF